MRLRDVMQTRVVTIDATKPAEAAWTRMRRHRIRHLVVTADGEPVGVISERDLGGREGGAVRKGRKVQDLMSRRLVSAEPGMTLREAANLMRGKFVGSLPVIEGDRLVGIVTATDVLDELGRGSTRFARRPDAQTLRRLPGRRQAKPIDRREPVGPADRARPREPDRAKRASFPGWLPRASKTEPATGPPAVPAYIRSAEGELGPAARQSIRNRLGRRLGKFAHAIERVSVRTMDVNGPRGGVDRVCRIKVVLKGLPSVVFESRHASLDVAVDEALAGVERSVRRALQRRRMKPLRRAA